MCPALSFRKEKKNLTFLGIFRSSPWLACSVSPLRSYVPGSTLTRQCWRTHRLSPKQCTVFNLFIYTIVVWHHQASTAQKYISYSLSAISQTCFFFFFFTNLKNPATDVSTFPENTLLNFSYCQRNLLLTQTIGYEDDYTANYQLAGKISTNSNSNQHKKIKLASVKE